MTIPVEVHSQLGGDASGTFVSPIGNSTYVQLASQLEKLETDEEGLVELGRILFQSLFQGDIKDVYKLSEGGLKEGQGLRLRFDIDPALTEIAGLPWEFLYDPNRGPLATRNMSVVRYLSQQVAPPALAAPVPLNVLVTGASTPPKPAVERELSEIHSALIDLEQRGHVKIQIEEHLTRQKLQRLLRGGFQVWHFIGHGAISNDGKSGMLVFEDESGDAAPISARELGIFLDRSDVRLIVLDACNGAKLTTDPYRAVAPALIRAQVPAVIAMQFTVPQEVTRAFAAEFYRALAEGFPIDACVTEGRKAIIGTTGLRNPDWGIPVVYTRAPDGKVIEPQARPNRLTRRARTKIEQKVINPRNRSPRQSKLAPPPKIEETEYTPKRLEPSSPSQPARILVVEDEYSARLTMSALLTRVGYIVMTAASGEEAVALFDQQSFDLMLVDLMRDIP